MKKILLIFLFFTSLLEAREIGQTEITTDEGIEVYQKEKYYLLKKNVEIDSDNFNLKAQKVKAYFDKDLYDIVEIYSEENVILVSKEGMRVLGNIVNYKVKDQDIHIEGKNSFLQNNKFTMKSDGTIDLNNSKGEFKLLGINSQLITSEIDILGEDIRGTYVNIDGENVVEKLNVVDKKQVNIKTETSNMFAMKAKFDRQSNNIELFENVKIIRDNELITGDYGKINTVDESYKIVSNKSNKVKAWLNEVNE